MPALSDVVGMNLNGYTPVSIPTSPSSSPNTSTQQNTEPGLNLYLRCPIPPIWQSSPDSLRQFYQNNTVPQTRLFNPTPPSAANQTVQNITNTTTQVTNVTSVNATQSSSLISSDGTTGSRLLYQTANPETTPPPLGWIYQNNNDTPLLVVVSADGGGGGFHGVVYCNAGSSLFTIVGRFSRVNSGSSNPNYYPGAVTFIVPPAYYYGISVTSGGGTPVGSNALDTWTEWNLGS